MNRHRFNSDMEAAWELRPHTDVTPETRSHPHRFNQRLKEQSFDKKCIDGGEIMSNNEQTLEKEKKRDVNH